MQKLVIEALPTLYLALPLSATPPRLWLTMDNFKMGRTSFFLNLRYRTFPTSDWYMDKLTYNENHGTHAGGRVNPYKLAK